MKTHRFTLVATGLDPESDEFEDRFFTAGCDDATISFVRGAVLIEFEREAESREEAVASAVADLGRAGANTARLEPNWRAGP